MEYGLFTMPSHPPERGLKEGHDWDLQVLRWADELGFKEGWIGEHHTAPWEPHPAPDLLVAQGLMQTKNIRLGPGGFLLPYHHPAELAHRVAMLDHLAEGRFNFGVAASGLPYTSQAKGFGDFTMTLLYRVYDARHSRLHLNFGLSLPSGSTNEAGHRERIARQIHRHGLEIDG